MHRYTLSGFLPELDWRPLYFVEPIPAHRICDACGMLPKRTIFLSCRHVLCKTCYEQCLVNEAYECPLDSAQFREQDAQWIEFPAENLLRRTVKCWNDENGCDAIMNVSDMIKHFSEDCLHHSTRCPNCSALVMCRSVCAHRKSQCSTHASNDKVLHHESSKYPVQGVMFTALETILDERVGEMKSGLDQVVRDHSTHCDKLNEVLHMVNALRETMIETSEKQACATNEARIATVREVKEDMAAQGDILAEVSQRIAGFGEDGKVIAEATRRCLENMEQHISEIKRRIPTDDNRLERVSETVSAFEGALDKALERATEIILQKLKRYVDFSAAAKGTESDQKTSDEKESQLLAQKTLGTTLYGFNVKGIKALKKQTTSTGWARSCFEPIYLCGYRISPGLYLTKNESSLSVHARMQLYKGVIDEFLQWPFSHTAKFTLRHPSLDMHRDLLINNGSDMKQCGRPTESSNTGFHCNASLPLEDLEREGYIEFDQLCVQCELVPAAV